MWVSGLGMRLAGTILGVVALFGCAYWVVVATLPTHRKVIDRSTLPNPVLAAMKKHEARGGYYIWGSNDCSIFVLDYMKASGIKVKRRYTTKDLYDPDTMGKVGYQASEFPEVGDIVVFRYTSRRPAGHCGIVVQQGEELHVVHNAESGLGIVMESLESFYNRAEILGAPRESLRFFKASSDR